jgi:hypothetical protein
MGFAYHDSDQAQNLCPERAESAQVHGVDFRTVLQRQPLGRRGIQLPLLLEEIVARTLLDAPCGDFNWIKDTELSLELYWGIDVIPDLIARNRRLYGDVKTQFVLLDLTRDWLPDADVILCRDCFIHFSYRHIALAIKNFKRTKSTYLLTNTYSDWRKNENIRTGDFRYLNLLLPPFNFPPPLRQIDEKFPDEQAEFFGKKLALWRLADL